MLNRLPALRILVPFTIGIIIQRWCTCWWVPTLVIALSAATYLWMSLLSSTPQRRHRFRPFFIVPLALAALSLGWLAAIVHSPPRLTVEQRQDQVLTGRVASLEYTDFSMRMTVDVLTDGLPPCRVLLSTRGCDYTLHAGQLIAWQGHLQEVASMGNPGEMDYAEYLLHDKGIRYQQHLPVNKVKKVGFSPTLVTRMANVRRSLRLKVLDSRLSAGAQRFMAALLLGDKGAIDSATRQEFSVAGIAHVLALSGLHVGFIALIIWWLLFPLDYLRCKRLRLVLTLAAIAAFAVFTGLSPSVCRSTLMVGCAFASLAFNRRSVSLNALAVAALAILVFSPGALYGVGFQLSFVTVGAILLLARVPERLRSTHQWINNLSATVITSLVAMVATIALSAHYFHTISLMSVVANVLVLPVLPVLMAAGALFLLVTAAGMHWQALDWVIDHLYGYIHSVALTVNALPLSHYSGVYVSTLGVAGYFVMLSLAVMWLYRRDGRWLLAAGGMMVALLAHSLWIDVHTPRQGWVIFNSFNSTPILYYDNGKGYVWTPDDEQEPDSAAFARYYAGFLAQQRIDTLHFVTNHDTLRLEGAMIKPPIAHLMGQRMMAVGSGRWKHMVADSARPLRMDVIIVTKRFHGTVSRLRELYQFDLLIISGAHREASRLAHECDSLQVSCHQLSRQGALRR